MVKGMKTLAHAVLAAVLSLTSVAGCSATTHPVAPGALGAPSRGAALEAVIDSPGPVTVTTVVSAEWEVDKSGLIDLTSDKAKAAHLVDGPEPIKLFVHVVHHPTQGTWLVDSGVERAFVRSPSYAVIHGWRAGLAHLDKLTVRTDMATLLEGLPDHETPRGVLLTHLHLDHVLGLRDVPASVPVFVGKGDAEETGFVNAFTQEIFDGTLAGKGPLQELTATPDPDGVWDGITDVFGDATVFALSVPGHTKGSTAFVIRTPDGPVLLTGDACHSAWGWENGVAPGTFSEDLPKSRDSLARLEALVARHPAVDVRLGHQTMPARASAR